MKIYLFLVLSLFAYFTNLLLLIVSPLSFFSIYLCQQQTPEKYFVDYISPKYQTCAGRSWALLWNFSWAFLACDIPLGFLHTGSSLECNFPPCKLRNQCIWVWLICSINETQLCDVIFYWEEWACDKYMAVISPPHIYGRDISTTYTLTHTLLLSANNKIAHLLRTISTVDQQTPFISLSHDLISKS